jgi:predicted nucleic acid-binding protein
MIALVDTNVLVYSVDPGQPEKRRVAEALLRQGASEGSVVLPHQAIVEFVSVTTRPRRGSPPLLAIESARRTVEELLAAFEVVYPDEDVLYTALRGAAMYGLSWYDAHLWAYAERYELDELLSEDFEHGRFYGEVRARNPFLPA